jgi:uncharacterized damage-inducible protein DinB
MTEWIAPAIDRADIPYAGGDEKDLLDRYLDYHRQTLLWKCSGLTGEQLARRSVPSSNMSLLGLLRHLTDVERGWFRRGIDQQPAAEAPYVYSTDERPDDDFDVLEPADAPAIYQAYLDERVRVREAAARHGLDETYPSRHRGPIQVRWVYLHMLEEYARHNGHADLLREAIDGATGE